MKRGETGGNEMTRTPGLETRFGRQEGIGHRLKLLAASGQAQVVPANLHLIPQFVQDPQTEGKKAKKPQKSELHLESWFMSRQFAEEGTHSGLSYIPRSEPNY